MIADLERFKLERTLALKAGDVARLREFAAKYGIKLPVDDAEALNKARKAQTWD